MRSLGAEETGRGPWDSYLSTHATIRAAPLFSGLCQLRASARGIRQSCLYGSSMFTSPRNSHTESPKRWPKTVTPNSRG